MCTCKHKPKSKNRLLEMQWEINRALIYDTMNYIHYDVSVVIHGGRPEVNPVKQIIKDDLYKFGWLDV
jgi:hypothetical protein